MQLYSFNTRLHCKVILKLFKMVSNILLSPNRKLARHHRRLTKLRTNKHPRFQRHISTHQNIYGPELSVQAMEGGHRPRFLRSEIRNMIYANICSPTDSSVLSWRRHVRTTTHRALHRSNACCLHVTSGKNNTETMFSTLTSHPRLLLLIFITSFQRTIIQLF